MSSLKTEIDNAPKVQRLHERQERHLKFSNLSEKQKSLLSAAGAGAAGISLGVLAMTLMGAAIPDENGEIKPPTLDNGKGMEDVEVIIHTDAPFAEGVNDAMSFGEAFKTARADVGAGGIFEWRGNLYNTYIKSEWDAMDKSERAAFLASIDQEFLPIRNNGRGERQEVEITIHSNAPLAEGVDDSMSFGDAFKTARAEVGPGGIFEWRGNLYNTYIKPEWDAMDKSERADFFASIDKEYLPATNNSGGAKEEVEVIIYTDAPLAEGVNDSMSFGDAFKTARAEVGAGGIFEWRGNLYNTYIKSEWDAMDKGERSEFFASIDKAYLPGDEDKEAEIIRIVNDDIKKIDDEEEIVIVEDEISDDEEIVIVMSENNDSTKVDANNGHGGNSFHENSSEDSDNSDMDSNEC